MGKHVGFRSVHADFTSTRGFRWPFPGRVAKALLPDGMTFTLGNPCPRFVGDGLCIAKTWAGAASGGIPALTCLVVEWDDRDVLGEDADKVRVRKAKVLEVLDVPLLARAGYLRGANLVGANLRGANLVGADLEGANLVGADLERANLRRANLRGAYLRGANLQRADLREAVLEGANLRGADLRGAVLVGAVLRGAVLPEGFALPEGVIV